MKIIRKKRNIGNSDNCRIKYGNPQSFDILEITICDGEYNYIYQIEAKYLSSTTDSIHFYHSRVNGKLKIEWVKWAAPYIKLITSPKIGFFQRLKLFIKQFISIFKG